ncbi:hypothetical protein [Corynebacterium aquilae]|uniref:Uncharacterized protein n=1 Tax=Corynebacterium aquilae DSM 44791 TaxID=1431546 RepID=A0A1L7CHH7_9CORY|nr:hypothetical protein [Corynebacterium aquilae]APT85321.1 hypothetical protein CAQU_09870 [Corynebacterium aquilae DSM 44791]
MASKVDEQRWRNANKTGSLRKHLLKVAEERRKRAEQLSRESGGEARYTVEEDIRPQGRAVVRVVSSSQAEEFGTDDTRRTNALRRAIRGE